MPKDRPTTSELDIKLDGYLRESEIWRKTKDDADKEMKEMLAEDRRIREEQNKELLKQLQALTDTISTVTVMAKSHEVILNGDKVQKGLVEIVRGEGGLVDYKKSINTTIKNVSIIATVFLAVCGFGIVNYQKNRDKEILIATKNEIDKSAKETITLLEKKYDIKIQ